MHHRHHHCWADEHQAAGRHGFRGSPIHGPRGFGPGFRGPAGPFRAGRMLGDGDLRLVVLALLAEQPRHGYDIIKALEERSHGAYSPSPGVVYPTLTYLEEAGYATAAAEGNKKVYAITDAGRAHLAGNRESADMILSAMQQYGEKMAKARAWFYRHEEGGAWDIPGVVPEVNDARRALKGAIAGLLEAPPDTQRAMAQILHDAAEAIRVLGGEESEG